MLISELGTIINGSGLSKNLFSTNGTVPAIHYGHIYTTYEVTTTTPIVKIKTQDSVKLKKVNYGDIVIAKTSENLQDIMKSVAYLGNAEAVTGGHAAIFKHNQNPKFISYMFNYSPEIIAQKNKTAFGVKVIELSIEKIKDFTITVPPIFVQDIVVRQLEDYRKNFNELIKELNHEIELRNKQYEYYRSRLLTSFK